MTIGCSLPVNRAAQVEIFDNRRWAQVEVSCYKIGKFTVGEFARAKAVDKDGDRPGNADGIGDLDFEALGKTCSDNVLCHVPCRIGTGTVNLGGILTGKGAAAMAGETAIGIDDDLSAGESRIAMWAPDYETAGRVDVRSSF